MRRYKRSRLTPNTVGSIISGLGAAYNMYDRIKQRGGTSTLTGMPFSSTGTMTTTQRNGVQTSRDKDFRMQYRKRRLPYRKRRRIRRAYRSFFRKSMKLVGSNVVIRNDSIGFGVTQPSQNWLAVHLGATNGSNTNEKGVNDINNIVSSDTRIGQSGKILIKSMNLDATARNTGEIPLEIDIYEINYWDTTKEKSYAGIQSSAQNGTPAIGSLTSLTLLQRGVQVFDFPELPKKGVSIYKKTKVFLPPGETTTYRLSNRKPKWINVTNDIVDNDGYVKPYCTRTLLFVYKLTVGEAPEATSTLEVGSTRRYLYKIFEDDADRDGTLP